MNNLLTLLSLFLSLTITTLHLVDAESVSSYLCPAAAADSTEATSPNDEPCFDTTQFEYSPSVSIEQNRTVEFPCYVKKKGKHSVIWLYENQLVSVDDRVIKPDASIRLDTDLSSRFNLRVASVDPSSNKGVYTCQVATKQARNLEYTLEVLVPPSIVRSPTSDLLTLNQGDSVTVQCVASGNPAPKLTWSKRGEKAEHTIVDETRSTLSLQNVDESHADTYSCTAQNGVGNPVTSEFQVFINCKLLLEIFISLIHNAENESYTTICFLTKLLYRQIF